MDLTIDVTKTALETGRLILRAWRETDVNDFYEYASVEGVGEMAGWKHHDSIEVTRKILQSFISEKNVFAIVNKENMKVIGSLGLHNSWANEENRYAHLKIKEVGYVLSKAYWGRGLMPEAVNAVIRFCFDECKLDALTIGHFSSNNQSRRVIEKCGFTFVKQSEYYAGQLQLTFDDMKYIMLNRANLNNFVKTHGLGNEYIVLDQEKISFELTQKAIKRICNVNFGIGSDGILLKVKSFKADFGLEIYNPDGSEAEKSGNGLRIFCKYIYDLHFTEKRELSVETKGGIVHARIVETSNGKAALISVDMGKAIFKSEEIPTRFKSEIVIGETIKVGDRDYEINCVSVGNPHCVIIKDNLDIDEIKKYGSLIERHDQFPNRINVQFAKVISKSEVEVLIWERGAGFTLASGSSSCAVASVLRKRGLIDDNVKIKMPGGQLKIEIDSNWNIRMTGEVRQIAQGILSDELIEDLDM